MQKYCVSLNGIVEADSEVDSEVEAIQVFKESAELGRAECFEYDNNAHPWGVKPSCEDAVNLGLKA